MWGNITIDWNGIIKSSVKGNDDHKVLGNLMADYIGMRGVNHNNKDIEHIIHQLASRFSVERMFGNIKGELRNREQENKLGEIMRDNENLAEQLKKAYIPSTDVKVGTN